MDKIANSALDVKPSVIAYPLKNDKTISAIKINYSLSVKNIECPRPFYYSLSAPEIKNYSIFTGEKIPLSSPLIQKNKTKQKKNLIFFQSRPSITPLFNPQGDLI